MEIYVTWTCMTNGNLMHLWTNCGKYQILGDTTDELPYTDRHDILNVSKLSSLYVWRHDSCLVIYCHRQEQGPSVSPNHWKYWTWGGIKCETNTTVNIFDSDTLKKYVLYIYPPVRGGLPLLWEIKPENNRTSLCRDWRSCVVVKQKKQNLQPCRIYACTLLMRYSNNFITISLCIILWNLSVLAGIGYWPF